MVIGRGRRREHPNQHFVLLLKKIRGKKVREKYGEKKYGNKKTTGEKSTGKKYGQIPSQLFDLRAVCRGNNELFLVPRNKTLKYLNHFLLDFYSKV